MTSLSAKSHARLFADDTAIYSTKDHQQLKEERRRALEGNIRRALETRGTSWSMKLFNPLICEHVKFARKRQNRITNDYKLYYMTIPKVSV